MGSVSKKGKRKTTIFLSTVIVLFLVLSMVATPSARTDFAKHGFLNATKKVGFATLNLTDSLGVGAIRAYAIQGRVVLDSLQIINDLGTGALATYQLSGKVFYTGLGNVSKSYGETIRKVSAFEFSGFPKVNVDENLSKYSSNVSGGWEIVSDFAKENTGKVSNSVRYFGKRTKDTGVQNWGNVLGGFQYIDETILEAPVKGAGVLENSLRSFGPDFVKNMRENLVVINDQSLYLLSSVSAGFNSIFDVESIKKDNASLLKKIKQIKVSSFSF